MKVDVHSHFMPRSYWDAANNQDNPYGARVQRNTSSGRTEILMPHDKKYVVLDQVASPEAKIEELDRFGLDIAVVSPPQWAMHHDLLGDAARAHARLINEGMAAVQADHGDRLWAMAMLPLQAPDVALEELDRLDTHYGLRAAVISANIDGRNLDEPEFRPVFAALAERRTFLFVHALLTKGTERLDRYRLFNAIGNPLDDCIAIYSLIYSGLLEEFPGLRICVAHGGGQAPYIAGRVDRGYHIHPELRRRLPRPPSEYLRLLYYDTIVHDQRALRYLSDVVGTGQILLGSDCPYHLIDMGDPDPVGTISAMGISDEEKAGIMGETAAELLGIR